MTIYDLIAQARREHPTPPVQRTLDLLVRELGHTRDNLRQATARLAGMSLPPGGWELINEILDRGAAANLDDLVYPEAPASGELEPADPGSIGILVTMAGIALVALALAAAAVAVGVQQIMQSG